MQAVIKRSQCKFEVLKDLGGVALRAEELEKELNKLKLQAAVIQLKLDNARVEHRNAIQAITAEKDDLVNKNKALRQDKKGSSRSTDVWSTNLIISLQLTNVSSICRIADCAG